jgi:hypothetical protein
MPTMRHPNVATPYEAVDEAQASMLRMSGWVTENENPDLFTVDAEPDDSGEEPEDDNPDEEPDGSGEKSSKKPRARRATSDKESN